MSHSSPAQHTSAATPAGFADLGLTSRGESAGGCGGGDGCACAAPADTTASAHSASVTGAAAGAEAAVDGTVLTELGVAGMTCAHCVASVTEELSELDGVAGVDVELVVGGVSRVSIRSAAPLAESAVASAIDEAGYDLAELPR